MRKLSVSVCLLAMLCGAPYLFAGNYSMGYTPPVASPSTREAALRIHRHPPFSPTWASIAAIINRSTMESTM